MFITFEGPEGCGKSTQIQLLRQYLEQQNRPHLHVREPGGTALGEQIRTLLLNTEDTPITPLAELLLFCSSRAQLLEERIRPALAAGTIVIADRFLDSTTVYQGIARKLGKQRTELAHQLTLSGTLPDHTLLFDLPTETGFQRVRQRQHEQLDRIEAESQQFHQSVRDGYLQLADQHPERIHRLDATQDIQTLHQRVLQHLKLQEHSE